MLQLFKGGLSKHRRLIKEKDLPDFETGHTENLRSAVQMGDESFYFFIVLLYTIKFKGSTLS